MRVNGDDRGSDCDTACEEYEWARTQRSYCHCRHRAGRWFGSPAMATVAVHRSRPEPVLEAPVGDTRSRSRQPSESAPTPRRSTARVECSVVAILSLRSGDSAFRRASWAVSARVGLGATAQTNRSVPIPPCDDFAPLQDVDQLPVGHVGGDGPHQVHVSAPPGPTDHSGGVGRTDRAVGKPMSREHADCRLGTSAEALVLGLIPPRSAAFAQGDLGCVYPLPGEPHTIRLTGTFRRRDRASGRHQLVDELFPKRHRNRRVAPSPASAVDRDPSCVVVHAPAIPTTSGLSALVAMDRRCVLTGTHRGRPRVYRSWAVTRPARPAPWTSAWPWRRGGRRAQRLRRCRARRRRRRLRLDERRHRRVLRSWHCFRRWGADYERNCVPPRLMPSVSLQRVETPGRCPPQEPRDTARRHDPRPSRRPQ